jgi:hypothetical protein
MRRSSGFWKRFGNATIASDRYGHLFPGNEEEAAGLLDAYLVRQIRA